MSLSSLLQQFNRNQLLAENVAFWQTLEARSQILKGFPAWLQPRLLNALNNNGISGLYSHQAEAVNLAHSGNNIVVTTGTASGKSLCYQIPILNELIKDGHSTSLLFFPTKALTYDQLKSMNSMLSACGYTEQSLLAAVYDGDTPAVQRSSIRQKTRILMTNPDMLNIGILPHHTNWSQFFTNLKYVVIDEIHLYRGVFGSHIANLIRRIKRIASFYGATPQFLMTSATIANPIELAEHLIEEETLQIEADGSPKGDKNFLIYNPPIINQELGIREGVLSTTTRLASILLDNGVQSLVFCQTRRYVELLLREIKNANPSYGNSIRGYRSGYLKKDRREIEEGLKSGSVKLAVATNALELGVDIGSVDAILMAGYPGSICSLRQRMGRSGRALNASVSILVTSMNPLDQYFARNPNYLLTRPLEKALINPNNPLILLPHIKSASFELPFSSNDSFGKIDWNELEEYLNYLCLDGVLHQKKNKYYWLSDAYPSNDYSLRSTVSDRILIQYDDKDEIVTIGEVDYESSLWMIHPGAVYMQDGLNYLVKTLDLENCVATLIDHHADYLTEPIMSQEIEPLQETKTIEYNLHLLHYGEIEVTSQVTGFKKVQYISRDVLSIEQLEMPQVRLQTTGFWIELSQKCIERMRAESLWMSDPNDYGKDWNRIRETIRRRDQFTCQSCGKIEAGTAFHVHHKIPFKSFTSIEHANQPDNLITLCPLCHRLAEINIRIRSALSGLKYLMTNLSPLLVLCEPSDLGSFVDPNARFADLNPIIMLYDAIPAGIGLASSLFEQVDELLKKCLQLANQCECQDGCPSCVGPASENGIGGKHETIYLLNMLLESSNHANVD